MKKIIQYISLAAVVLFVAPACKKSFDSLYVNPNKPTSVPPSLLLNGVLNDMYEAPFGSYERWDQYFLINYDYYGNNRYDFGSGADYYNTLKNVTKMEEEGARISLPSLNPYYALAKFFKAYYFTKMSMEMGDIPMTDALKGVGNLKPTYDAQSEVFKQAFLWLDSANNELGLLVAAGDNSLQGDIYFNNNVAKWQKTVNALRLRLLLHLSMKADDPDLNVKEQFAEIISDPAKYPLMEDMSDNLQYQYLYPSNPYPNNPGNYGFDALRDNCSATYLGILTSFQDPRTFVTSEPATAKVSAGISPTNFAAFLGADPGEDLGTMYNKANSGAYSLLNRKRYYETFTAEPSIQIGYPEMLFNIAEGINRGWANNGPKGNAEAYYTAGIQASWAFYNIPLSGPLDVFFLKSGSPGTASAVYDKYTVNVNYLNYYGQVNVSYLGDNANGLKEILTQKYLALFRHSGLEAYYNYRRTGVPNFTTGPGTGNSERIALRFQYPGSEKTANDENYNSALQNQYGGNDDINAKMWLIK